ncbi:MAG: hypothetical protein AAGD07_12955 [Planctomycetota bacterium]
MTTGENHRLASNHDSESGRGERVMRKIRNGKSWCVSRLVIALSPFLWLSGDLGSSNADDFQVKQVVYEPAVASFQLQAKLDAGEETKLTITVPVAESEIILSTLRATASLSTADKTEGVNKVIEATVKADRAADVTLAYSRPITLSDVAAFHHRLTLGAEEAATLSTSITVKDASGSDANWAKAKTLVRHPTTPLEFSIDLAAKGSKEVPVGTLWNYAVAFGVASADHLFVAQGSARRFGTLGNSGDQTIPTGALTAYRDSCPVFRSKVEKALPPGKESILSWGPAVLASIVKIQGTSTANVWRTLSARNGSRLKIKTSKKVTYKVTKPSGKELTLTFSEDSKSRSLAPDVIQVEYTFWEDEKSTVTADLLDISDATLANHVTQLSQTEFGIPDFGPVSVRSAVHNLTQIQNLNAQISSLQALIAGVKVDIKALANTSLSLRSTGELNENLTARLRDKLSEKAVAVTMLSTLLLD